MPGRLDEWFVGVGRANPLGVQKRSLAMIMKVLPLFVIVVALQCTPGYACPHCNIHNYLAKSVESASNIYVGQIVAIPEENTARVKVLEVLRGTHSPDDQVTVEFYGDRGDIGRKYLFSNPTSWPPDFPTLSLSLKDEVSFLIRKDRKIIDPKDAVKRLQGISRVTTNLAIEYIKAHFPECREHLFDAYRNLYEQKPKWNDIPVVNHRFEMLVKGITAVEDQKSIEFLQGCVDTLAAERASDISWKDRPFRGEPQGNILKTMLSRGEEPTIYYKTLKAHVRLRVTEMDGPGIRWFAYALASDDLDASVGLLRTPDPKTRAAAAVGAFDLSEFHRSWWAIEDCDNARELALSLHEGPELRQLAEEQNKRLSFFRGSNDR